MALTWDLGKIKNYEEVCFKKNEDGTETMTSETEAMIWATMAVGIGRITDLNAADFYSRIHFYEKVFGSFLISFEDGNRTEHYLTPEIVNNHIGLHTNVGKETDAAFRTRIFKNFVNDYKRKYQIDTKNEV